MQVNTEREVVEALLRGYSVVDADGDEWALGACTQDSARFDPGATDLAESEVVFMLCNGREFRGYQLCARPKGFPRLSFDADMGPFLVLGGMSK